MNSIDLLSCRECLYLSNNAKFNPFGMVTFVPRNGCDEMSPAHCISSRH